MRIMRSRNTIARRRGWNGRRRLSLLLLVCLGWACGGDEPSDPCASVTLTVTFPATDPVFDWTSDCPAAALDVAPSDSDEAFVWAVLVNPGQNAIRGPITYGVAPEGTAVTLPADSLVSGRQYRVQIRRTVGPADFGLELVGEADFTVP